MLRVANIRVRSFDLDYLDIFWDIEATYEDLYNFSFILEKSHSEFGPFHAITKEFSNKFHVRDNTVRTRHSFYTHSYYKITVKNLTTSETSTFPENGPGVRLSAPPDLIALEMARINRLKLREFSGRKIWIFPRKKFGQRCTCYDRVTSRKLRSNCLTCFDTSWVGGFNTPLEIFGQIIDPEESTQRTLIAEIEQENTVVVLPNYPEMFEGDIIIEAENIRWRVGSPLKKIRKGRSLIKQIIPIHRIPSSDIEYSLPLNLTESLGDLVAAPPRNLTSPQTLESADSVTTALEFYTS